MKMIVTLLFALVAALGFAPSASAEKAPNVHEPKVVAFGDSITWGVGTKHPGRQSWPARIGAHRVAHAGSGLVGARNGMEAGIDTYRSTVLPKNPDIVIVAYGMNDLHWSTTPEIMAGLRQTKRWNNAKGIETYIATLTPIGEEYEWAPALDPQRRELNDKIRAVFGDHVIDFDEALADSEGYLPERYDSGDELHPSVVAYAKMAKVAERSIMTQR